MLVRQNRLQTDRESDRLTPNIENLVSGSRSGDEQHVPACDPERTREQLANRVVGPPCLGWGRDPNLQSITEQPGDPRLSRSGDGLDANSQRIAF